jgi:hypothetical protein
MTAPKTTPTPDTPAPGDAVSRAVWPWRDTLVDGAEDAARAARSAARRRGVVRAVIGFAAALALSFWKPVLGLVVAAISLLVLLLAVAAPIAGYGRLERGIDRFAHGVGTAVTWLLMPLLFYLLFFPVGLLLRSVGNLRLTRRPDGDLASYWWRPEHPEAGWQRGETARYRRQF